MNIKIFLFTFFSLIFTFQFGFATTPNGCSNGTKIYPNFSGTYYANCPIYCPANIPIYLSTDGISIQTWNADPQCGVQFGSDIIGGLGQCKIGSTWGNLVHFTATANTCPLDDYVYWLLFPSAVFGFLIVRQRKFLITEDL